MNIKTIKKWKKIELNLKFLKTVDVCAVVEHLF